MSKPNQMSNQLVCFDTEGVLMTLRVTNDNDFWFCWHSKLDFETLYIHGPLALDKSGL